jgi:hypothetical protein
VVLVLIKELSCSTAKVAHRHNTSQQFLTNSLVGVVFNGAGTVFREAISVFVRHCICPCGCKLTQRYTLRAGRRVSACSVNCVQH